MIRHTALFAYALFFSVYAWRNWFVSLCALLPFMTVQLHPDMPRTMLGVQGLSPWNIMLGNTMLAWLLARSRQGPRWDLPPRIRWLLLGYLLMVVVGFLRLIADPGELRVLGYGYLTGEYLINSVKWVLPGLLLYDACRIRERCVPALAALLSTYVLLGVQVIRWMPLSYALSAEDLSARSAKILLNEIGYHRVTMALLLAGGFWALLAFLPLCKSWRHRAIVMICAAVVAFALALTAGRAGYATWGVVGLTLCVLRWRRLLLLIPVTAAALVVLLPGVSERLLIGFDDRETVYADVTSGRTIIWPYVIDKIGESPLVGHGRQAMIRTGLSRFLAERLNEDFGHPHNAYLELLLDSGILGFLLVIPYYLIVVSLGMRLLRDRADPVHAVVGGVALALTLALLVAGLGSHSFYPRELSVGMWAAMGIMLQVSTERSRSRHSDVRWSRAARAHPAGAASTFQPVPPTWHGSRTS